MENGLISAEEFTEAACFKVYETIKLILNLRLNVTTHKAVFQSSHEAPRSSLRVLASN
jgi:hypothetical protein